MCAQLQVLAELDQPGEWYLDKTTKELYLWPNTTDGLPAGGLLIAPHLETLVDIHGRDQYAPASNISFVNVAFRHAKPTILSPRGYSVLLGGGDYAMVKAAAIVAENVDGLRIEGCSFSRLDGNAVMLYSYVRNAVVTDNLFYSLGANAIVSWGVAEFQEGTRGTNPEGTQIIGNFASEIGLLEKQGCFYFQALSALAVLERNIAFNGPRAAINCNILLVALHLHCPAACSHSLKIPACLTCTCDDLL